MCRVSRKVGSLKRRVRSHVVRGEIKNCTPLWREAHFEVKMLKKLRGSDHFLKLRCGKIARRCGEKHILSENAKKLVVSEHFLKLRCGKIARRCGEKRILKSKCTKHCMLGPLFEVAMFKNCTQLWREAHFEVKMYKTLHTRATF